MKPEANKTLVLRLKAFYWRSQCKRIVKLWAGRDYEMLMMGPTTQMEVSKENWPVGGLTFPNNQN